MSVQIIVKNSSVEDKRPTSGQLAEGEIALNYNAAGAFLTCKDTNGDIQQVGGVKISENAPSDPPKQCLWFKPSTLTLFVYDGTTFLPLTGGGGGGGGGSIDQIVGSDGISAITNSGIATVSVDLVDDRGLIISGGKLAGAIATTSSLGVVKVGSGLSVESDGTLNCTVTGGGGLDAVNLDYTAAASGGTVTNDAGNDASIPDATNTTAGLFTGTEKQKLAGIEDGANVGITAITGGTAITIQNDTEINADIATDTTLGVVKAGSGIGITPDGTISATGTVTIDLDYTPAVDKGTITNTGGTEAEIPLADGTNAGLFTAAEKTKLAGIEDNANVGITDVNLGYTAAASGGTVTNDAGNDASIPDATDTTAGLFTGAEKQKLAGIADNANVGLTAVNLGYTAAASGGTVTNDAGSDASIPDATNTTAGLFTGAEKQKLTGIEDGANVGLTAVNLGYTAAASGGTVTNDAGNDASIPDATNTEAGLFTGAEKQKLAGIEDNATNQTTNDARYLRKDVDDTAAGKILFTGSVDIQNGAETGSLINIDTALAGTSPRLNIFTGTPGQQPGVRVFKGDNIGSNVVFDLNAREDANSTFAINRYYRLDGGTSNRAKAIAASLKPTNVKLRGGSVNSNNQPACFSTDISFTAQTDVTALSLFNCQAIVSSDPGTTSVWNNLNGFQMNSNSIGYNDGTTDISLLNTKITAININLNGDGTEAGATDVFQIYAQGLAPSYFNGVVKNKRGIEFESDGLAVAAVDDKTLKRYEKGTFTPSLIQFDAANMTVQRGYYEIVGDICTCSVEITYDSASGSNAIAFTTPFAGAAVSGAVFSGISGGCVIYSSSGTLTDPLAVLGRVNVAEASISKGGIQSGNSNTSRLRYNDAPSGNIRATFSYRALVV